MTLSDFLDSRAISDAEFAASIGVTRQSLYRYKRGQRTPRRETFRRIIEVTEGAVTANDFVAPPSGATSVPPLAPRRRRAAA